jgi:hypothetical protein
VAKDHRMLFETVVPRLAAVGLVFYISQPATSCFDFSFGNKDIFVERPLIVRRYTQKYLNPRHSRANLRVSRLCVMKASMAPDKLEFRRVGR